MDRSIGIDLGQTTALIAVLEGGKPTVVPDAEGSRTTPSVVEFAMNGEVFVGKDAEKHAATNMDRTIRSPRRHMGTDWIVDIDGKKFTPQHISAYILQKLKRDAEAYLGEKITDAVITVPALFSDAQRQATKAACQIVGLTVLRIINEPVAAALAYRLDRQDGARILVFDLDRQTLHVSLLIVSEGVVRGRAAREDNYFGGDDWDQRIVDWLVQDFKNGYGIDLSKDKMALQRLREAAEKAKIELSQSMESQINLPYISHSSKGPLHLDAKLTRAEFQRMTSDLLDRCKGLIQKVIVGSRVMAADIDHVVLVGDSTRMPAVVNLVRSLTGGKEPCNDIDPDEVVAFGACLQAGLLKGDSRLLDEAPLADNPRIAPRGPSDGFNGQPARLFISYSHRDESHLEALKVHLAGLRRQGLIADWHDRMITPGEEWRQAIDDNLESADCVLLMVTPDFIASDFCYSVEMGRALQKHREHRILVLPVIVRPADWQHTPLGDLQVMPKDGKPIVLWSNPDLAWLEVATGLRLALNRFTRRT